MSGREVHCMSWAGDFLAAVFVCSDSLGRSRVTAQLYFD